MDKFIKKLTGLFIAFLMALTLTGRANADNEESDVPAPAPTVVVESALPASAAEIPASETPAAETPASETPAAETPDSETPAAEILASETPAAETPASETSAAETPAMGTASASARNTTLMELSLRGLADETAANELVLVGDMGIQTVTTETDITIKSAGFQHIDTLYSDGDVYIIGTGILLVDNVDLLVGKNVYLQSIEEIYGEDGGTVALFAATGETDENGNTVYMLINGTAESGEVIPAVLDEDYVIPAGITLTVPGGATLVMQSWNVVVESGYMDGEEVTVVNYYTEGDQPHTLNEGQITESSSNTPSLTIFSGACLVIEETASFLLNNAYLPGLEILAPRLLIDGLFHLDGTMNGGVVEIGTTGDVTGSGFMEEASSVTVEGGRETALSTLNVTDTLIHLDDAGQGYINSLNSSGKVILRFDDDCNIGSVTVTDGTLTIINEILPDSKTMTIGGTVSGTNGSVLLKSGKLLLQSADCMMLPVRTTSSYNDGSTWIQLGRAVTDEDGTLRQSEGGLQSAPIVPLVGEAAVSGEVRTIPVASGNYRDHIVPPLGWCSYSEYNSLEAACDEDGLPIFFECDSDAQLDYAVISDVLGTEYLAWVEETEIGTETGTETTTETHYENYIYLVVTCTDGVYDYTLLSYGSSQSVNAADVVQICRMYYFVATDPMGGSTASATTTAYTGSGVLGGSGAGSVRGGTQRLAFSGGRTNEPDEPEPTDNPGSEDAPNVPEAPAAGWTASADELKVWAEPNQAEDLFVLHIEINGRDVSRVAEPVKVSLKYVLSGNTGALPLYAVFIDEQGKLVAFEAHYDPETGLLTFETDVTGEFVVIAFAYDGAVFSEEFYKALADLESVRALTA